MCECNKVLWEELDQVIESHKNEAGALIPVLHEAQGIFGYLPYEVQERIAEGLGLSMAKVYGVVTFYSQFSLYKKGKYRINVCMGTACYVKGSGEIMRKFQERLSLEVGECTEDGLYSLDSCRCVGACGLAPVVTINDEVYGRLTPEDVDAIIDQYDAKDKEQQQAEGGQANE